MVEEAELNGNCGGIESFESTFSNIATSYTKYPRAEAKFDYNNAERSAIEILPSILPESFPANKESSVSVTTVCGGITNKLFRCEIYPDKNDRSKSRVVLVRVFGAEGLIDREIETMQFLALSQANLGPPYYGRFTNGRVEGFYEGCRTLTPIDLSMPDLSRKIAVQMAK